VWLETQSREPGEHPKVLRSNQKAIAALLLAVGLTACTSVTESVEQADLPLAAMPHALIPVPATIELASTGTFSVSGTTVIVVDPGNEEAARIGRLLAGLIGNTAETTPEVVAVGAERNGPHIRLKLDESVYGDEAYELVVTSESVTLTASATAGLFYGVQTIRQLLPPYVEYGAAYELPLEIPAGRIVDAPRFQWRGAMLDVSRHFLPPEAVKRYMDLMAMYKLNRLHMHLSDDQGWRIEVASRPRLTEHGASTEVGAGSGGFYSIDDWADLVRHAEQRFIMLVPEIDMPGHTNAALASYPELTCDGEAPPLYSGTEVGFSFLCVENRETYTFVEDVVHAIAAMTPGSYFHLGGDEVHQLTPDQYAQFMLRAQAIVADAGKIVIGWDEIAEAQLELAPGTIVQVWRPQTEATARAVADAVARGASVILSPADRIYLDMKYDATTVLGLDWAGHSDVRIAYSWEPATHIPGVPESSILGVEAPLWSESLQGIADFEYMAFPRLAGVAEIGWSPAAARDWETYRLRLGAHGPRWIALGVNFYRAPDVAWQQMRR
jgi:hexosaminidase